MALVDIQVPDIGDFDEVAVIELLVKPGDTVKAEQSLLTVESDKASMEIPSSHAGVVKALRVKLGDKVKQGSVIVVLEVADVAGAASAPFFSTLGEGQVAAEFVAVAMTAPPHNASFVATPVPAPVAAPVVTAVAVAPASVSAASTLVEVRVPNIGDFKDVAVIELLAQPGDAIVAEQSLLTVESDKASMEIPSSSAGVLKELRVKMGDKVNIGDVIALMEVAVGAALAATAPVAAPTAAPTAAPITQASAPAADASAPAADASAAPATAPAAANASAAK